MVEEDLTPYLVVNAKRDGVQVPKAFVQDDGTITLNLSGHAIRNFAIEPDGLGFNSRFQGQPHSIWVPVGAILGLVSREASDGSEALSIRKKSGRARRHHFEAPPGPGCRR